MSQAMCLLLLSFLFMTKKTTKFNVSLRSILNNKQRIYRWHQLIGVVLELYHNLDQFAHKIHPHMERLMELNDQPSSYHELG